MAVCLSPSQALFSWLFVCHQVRLCSRGCLFVTKSGCVLLAVCLSPSQALFFWLFVCHQVRLCSRDCLFVTKSGSVLVTVCLSSSQAVFSWLFVYHQVRSVLVAGCLSPNQAVFSGTFVSKSGCQVILQSAPTRIVSVTYPLGLCGCRASLVSAKGLSHSGGHVAS